MASRDDLIYDRTQQDVLNAYNTSRIEEDHRGCFNASDLNRICDITNKIVQKLNNDYNARIEGDNFSTNYTVSSMIYYNDLYEIFSRIREAIVAYNRNSLQPAVELEMVAISEFIKYKKIDYIFVNNVEQVLYNMCVGLNIN